ncbi:MAG TPA: hypothetical protein VNA04_15015 [Thermoanaerobaculia bacterium]|nr:hypothetical protein [Thermoanaerobaculia bacterium]
MNPGILLLLVVTSTLVLRSGERIEVQGALREADGQVVFRVPGGPLYSLPAAEVDLEATQAAQEAARAAAAPLPRRLKVTPEERDRLLAELAKNHSGQPPEPQRLFTELPPPPSRRERAAERDEEWRWRREARRYEESVLRAEEQLQLLEARAAQLESEISGLLSLGFVPRQFSYQTTTLAFTRQQIPPARLAVSQARRVLEQFREDARRQGVMPGWLR